MMICPMSGVANGAKSLISRRTYLVFPLHLNDTTGHLLRLQNFKWALHFLKLLNGVRIVIESLLIFDCFVVRYLIHCFQCLSLLL